LIAAAAIGCAAPGAWGEEPDAAAQAQAHKLAVTVCGTCHGPQGNSKQPKFPRLAGQNANYLAAQLKAFRSQARGDPDALGYMWGMAAELDDDTIAALAAYYAAQKPEPGPRADQTQVGRGREIYEQGISAEGVPACSSCHGPDAHGTQDFPRLAGQHEQYILKQLSSFQSNMRKVAIMHGVAQNLRVPEMESVAAFLQSQP
ncbi:MAG: cytochrome c4, partial [Sinobacteraceae bacterium]|nr:cytochrome c4 [Nevskiaceae bacterium]MBV9317887.1 cytochrome c4 [Gammaproteobacteria bacterium]